MTVGIVLVFRHLKKNFITTLGSCRVSILAFDPEQITPLLIFNLIHQSHLTSRKFEKKTFKK